MIDTRAIVLCQAAATTQTADEQWVAFKPSQTLRGDRHDGLLFERGGGTYDDAARYFPSSLFVPGAWYVVCVGPGWMQWTRINEPADQAGIDALLKPYRAMDAALKLSPWDATRSTDLMTQAAARVRYESLVDRGEYLKFVRDYLALEKPTNDERYLFGSVLEARERHGPAGRLPLALARAVFSRMADPPIERDPWAYLAGCVLPLIDYAKEPGGTALLVKALVSKDWSLRHGAYKTLKAHKVSGTLAAILRDVDAGGDRRSAVEALMFQDGAVGLTAYLDILKTRTDKASLAAEIAHAEYYIAPHIAPGHLPALKALDDPSVPRLHGWVSYLRCLAGDAAAGPIAEKHYRDAVIHFPTRLYRHGHKDPAAAVAFARECLSRSDSCRQACEILAEIPEGRPHLVKFAADNLATNDRWEADHLAYLARFGGEPHREFFERHAGHENAPRKFLALLGLARLGNEKARQQVVLMAGLGDGMTHYYAEKWMLQSVPYKDLEKSWQAMSPVGKDAAEMARHAYLGRELTAHKHAAIR